MKRHLSGERGSAFVTAIVLTGVMMVAGLATFAMADNQQQQSGRERIHESTFNLVEAVTSGQVFQLSRAWPGSPGTAYPASCTPSSTDEHCPDPNNLKSSFNSADYGTDTTWETKVRDNQGNAGSFYNDAVATGQPSYDQGGPVTNADGTPRPDGKVWVEAKATVRGRTRRIVTMVKAGEVSRPFPTNTVTAGFVDIIPNAPKVMIDTNGDANQFASGDVAVRCTAPAPSTCLDYEPGRGQIAPDTACPVTSPTISCNTGYPAAPAMSPEALNELRTLAQARNTYYPAGSCPTSLTGKLVFIENGNCSYSGSGDFNSPTDPGMVVFARGTLNLSGSRKFYGLVYAANLQQSTGVVVQVNGTAEIHGAVAVDGNGGVKLGSNGVTLFYDPSVFTLPLGYGNASAIQGTWRELY